MKNFYLLTVLFLTVNIVTKAQLPIAYYDFENNSHTAFLNQVKLEVNGGSTSFANTGGSLETEDGAGLTYNGIIPGFGLKVKNSGSSPNVDPKLAATHYQQIKVNTSGFSGIGLEFDIFVNNVNSEFYGINYSTDNMVWNWLGSVTTPGTNNFAWNVSQWSQAKISLPASVNNLSNLYIRVYEYNSGNNGSNPYLIFDNFQVTALSTTASSGVKNMIDESVLYANCRSGSVVSSILKRTQFTVDGAGTIVNLNALYISGVASGAGGYLTVSNNAVLNLNNNANQYYIEGTNGAIPASVINILSGGTINLSNTLDCKGNINLVNGTLNINNQVLKIGGNISRTSGLINASAGTIEFTGISGAQAIAGSFFTGKTVYNLKNSNTSGINISSSLNDTLRVTGIVSFGSVNNTVISTGDNLTLVSNANGSAAVADITNNNVNNGNSIQGKVTVEKYIAIGKKWNLIAIPTNTTQTYRQAWQENNLPGANAIPGYGMNIYSNGNWSANGFDNASSTPTIKTFNPATAVYTGISSTLNVMSNTEAHMVYLRGDRSITASSTTTTSAILRTTGTLKQNTQADVVVPAGKFVAVNNPYAAAVDMRLISKTTGVQDFFYVWDPKLGGNYGLGAFQLFSKQGANYVVTPGGGSYGPGGSVNNFIKSGQGFFVRGATGTGTISFKENAKASGSNAISTSREGFEQSVRANLFVVMADTSLMADGVLVNFDDNSSNMVDDNDAVKIANGSENVSLVRAGTMLSIENRQSVSDCDSLFLNLTGLRVQNYKWELNLSNLAQGGLSAFLTDSYLNTTRPLDMNGITEVNFSVENMAGSYAANRFMIVLRKVVVLPVNISTISAYRNGNSSIAVNFNSDNEINMKHFEVERSADAANFTAITNLAPKATNGGSANYIYNDVKPLSGDNFYRIKAISVNGSVQYSAVVKVSPVKSTAGINVYPNPVVNKMMNIQFSNQETGNYSLSLINQFGQAVYQNDIKVNGNNSIRTVSLSAGIAAGNYELVVTTPGGIKTVQQLIIL